jgi:LacI family transcriptional regulator
MTHSERLDLSHIAQVAGVNPQEVWQMVFGNRQGLSGEAIGRIQTALDRLQQGPVEPQIKGKTGAILIIMPNTNSFGTFGGPVMQAFSVPAQQHGYVVSSYVFDTEPNFSLVSLCRAFNYVLMITTRETSRLVEACESAGRPYILAETDDMNTGQNGVAISLDNRLAARTAMDHLLKLGHRRIGFITGQPGHPATEARLESYLAGLRSAGIAPDPAWIATGDWEEESGYQAARKLLALPEPLTAIFSSNDTMALGLLRAASEANRRIGKDLSVMGCDDIEAASRVTPPLTTMRQHLGEMGTTAFECVRLWSIGQRPRSRILLPAELVVRQSTGPVPRRSLSGKAPEGEG